MIRCRIRSRLVGLPDKWAPEPLSTRGTVDVLQTTHLGGENHKSLLFRDFCPSAPGPNPDDVKGPQGKSDKVLKRMVGANGFEPSTSWSRTRKSKNHKCRTWCRLRDRWPLIPALELDGSWTEIHAAEIDQRWPTMRHSCHRLRELYVDASGPLRCARLTHALARRECAVLHRWWRRFAKPNCPVCTR